MRTLLAVVCALLTFAVPAQADAGTFKLVHQRTGECLVQDPFTTALTTLPCGSATWQFRSNQIIEAGTNRCVAGAEHRAFLWSCTGGPEQRWSLATDSQPTTVVHLATKQCLQADPVILAPCGTFPDLWRVTP